MATLTLPGLVDAHVHLRQPGAAHKEDVLSGTSAALAGGFVLVLDMPNTRPPTVDRQTLAHKRRLFEGQAVCDYGFFAGYTGGGLRELLDIAPFVVGLKLYLDETFGQMTLGDDRALAAVFEAWPGPGPIAVHGEPPSIGVALKLAARYHQALHICHVPHPDLLLDIDRARQGGVTVSCEVTPHHLFLSIEDEARLGPFARMKPPLLASPLVALFWERLDLVDAIASDHAPHTVAEKESSQSPPGVPGLETTLPLLLRAVDEGRLSLERLEALLHTNPLRVYGLAAPEAARVTVELGEPYRLPFGGYRTRCGWSPFVGQWALGRVMEVILRGRPVWRDGRSLVRPGYGQEVRRAAPALQVGREEGYHANS
ncbi:MAG: amidohydrolase family protein [Chloroflexi bacterium]|nr:amidohydrolase family protein [Chloroflexota bacterium]